MASNRYVCGFFFETSILLKPFYISLMKGKANLFLNVYIFDCSFHRQILITLNPQD